VQALLADLQIQIFCDFFGGTTFAIARFSLGFFVSNQIFSDSFSLCIHSVIEGMAHFIRLSLDSHAASQIVQALCCARDPSVNYEIKREIDVAGMSVLRTSFPWLPRSTPNLLALLVILHSLTNTKSELLCLLAFKNLVKFGALVEPAGIEPASKQGKSVLSTSLSYN